MTLTGEIIGAIADAKDIDPEDLDIIIGEYVDMDAIQALDDHENDLWKIQFELPNHTVQVTGDGVILVDGAQQRTFG